MKLQRRTFLAGAAGAALATTFKGQHAMAQNRKKYRACVIGDTKQGGHGHNLHMVWGARDDVEVAALADPDEQGRKARANQCGAQRTYADYREMLEKEKPDLVSIGPRWTVNHKDYLLAAAGVGAHGILEKPIATDLAEADAMVKSIEAKNLKWAIGFNFRALPVYQHAKKMVLEEGLIGEVLEIRSRGKEDRRAGGEDLIVLGTHTFDMMIDLFGNPTWCASDVQDDGKPSTKEDVREATEPLGLIIGDCIQATFGFPGGIYGHFATMKNADGNGGRWGLDIHGSKGIVSIRLTEIPQIYWLPDPSWAPGARKTPWQPLPGMPEMVIEDAHVERYAPVIHGLMDAIEEDREPDVSLQDGRDAFEMIQAVFAAHVNGGRINMPLKQRVHPLKSW